jgi:hypothetical protein
LAPYQRTEAEKKERIDGHVSEFALRDVQMSGVVAKSHSLMPTCAKDVKLAVASMTAHGTLAGLVRRLTLHIL